MIPHPYTGKNQGEGRAVPSDFRLPWNTTRSMADVWGQPKVRGSSRSKEPVVRTYSAPPPVTPRGKIAFAGYDKSESQIKRFK